MVDYPILEKDEDFIKKLGDLILNGISSKDVKIDYTRNGYSLGIRDDFDDILKKELSTDEKTLQKLISSLFRIYTHSIRNAKSIEKLREEHSDKIDLILSFFSNEVTENIILKSESTGNFLENIRWNILNLEDSSSEEIEKIKQFKYVEITFEYSNPQTHADHYETLTLKVSKKELVKLISILNDSHKKIIANE